jgi:hypothetical protein
LGATLGRLIARWNSEGTLRPWIDPWTRKWVRRLQEAGFTLLDEVEYDSDVWTPDEEFHVRSLAEWTVGDTEAKFYFGVRLKVGFGSQNRGAVLVEPMLWNDERITQGRLLPGPPGLAQTLSLSAKGEFANVESYEAHVLEVLRAIKPLDMGQMFDRLMVQLEGATRP